MNAYRVLEGKSGENKPIQRLRRRCKDNIKLYIREIVWDGMDWINLGQERNTVMKLRVL
jgi:hypothetical protein